MLVQGSVAAPGDKSVTHRLLLLAGLTPGRSRIRGALTSLDARSTARVLRLLGVAVTSLRPGQDVFITGRSRFQRPRQILHCGNSGTTARLLLGLLAGHWFKAVLTGDKSLRSRPMRRVTEPLNVMGAEFEAKGPLPPDRLPLAIRGGPLHPVQWELPVSSAQIKGALLLAGLAGKVPVSLREPRGRSRDHTERLLRAFGFAIEEATDGWIHFQPTGTLEPFDLEVPGDISSAAFLAGVALLATSGALHITGVGINPTRTGLLRVLERMGARITVTETGVQAGEPVGDLHVQPGPLSATTVPADEIPGLIDEIPLLAVLASRASGESRFHEVGELRVKESDRLGLLADNLRAVGGSATVEGNSLIVKGRRTPPAGRVRTEGDHRIAMAFAVLGMAQGANVEVDNLACAAVSFPGFSEVLRKVTGR
ncbi:MAG: 3-phosphoshikimate 1-carboxyvinyltransferase [Gemmatimonadales bacterium]